MRRPLPKGRNAPVFWPSSDSHRSGLNRSGASLPVSPAHLVSYFSACPRLRNISLPCHTAKQLDKLWYKIPESPHAHTVTCACT